MFCLTRSKVALVEFLCLIFSQRGALILTLPVCMIMWSQQFSLINGMFMVFPPKDRLKKFRKLYKCSIFACGCKINIRLLQLYGQFCASEQKQNVWFVLFFNEDSRLEKNKNLQKLFNSS